MGLPSVRRQRNVKCMAWGSGPPVYENRCCSVGTPATFPSVMNVRFAKAVPPFYVTMLLPPAVYRR